VLSTFFCLLGSLCTLFGYLSIFYKISSKIFAASVYISRSLCPFNKAFKLSERTTDWIGSRAFYRLLPATLYLSLMRSWLSLRYPIIGFYISYFTLYYSFDSTFDSKKWIPSELSNNSSTKLITTSYDSFKNFALDSGIVGYVIIW